MTSKYGPGYPGNTQSSPSQDTKLPSKPNEGDPCFGSPATPWVGRNAQSAGTTAGVQSQAEVNRPRGTRGSGTTHNAAPIGK